MAIYYALTDKDKKAIYGTAEKWKNECLLDEKSLIWDGEPIWTDTNINRFRSIFIEQPDASGDSFDDKLKKQLENESVDVHKFVIELLFIYYIYPVKQSISYETKMRKLETIASWKGIEFDRSLPVFDALKKGLGTTGTFFNTSKYFEVSFLFWLVDYLKSQPLEKRKKLLKDANDLKSVTDDVRQQVGKRVQMQHIILHLLLPKKFERISSWGHKNRIVKTYSNLIKDDSITDVDKKLSIIREKLEKEYPNKPFDYYETKPVAQEWGFINSEDNGSKQYFWITSNPSIWTVDNIKDGGTINYTAYNENGNKRRVFSAFEKAESGDLVIFYESTPTLSVVAKGEVVKGLHKTTDEVSGDETDVISFRYLEDLSPVSWSEISNHALLKKSSVVGKRAQGSLFELTKQEYETIINWNDDTTEKTDNKYDIPSINFNVEPFENGLVFENLNVLMSQVITALQNGKHIILTGPPGTGKSKLASKICEMYKVQSTMVTAASNWSTYETIGGYRPDREGNLYFDDGIFLECVKNKETSKPENKWLIIDEINRADIDKAFGSLFSVLTGDEVTLPFESKSGESIQMKPQGEMTSVEPDDHTYVVSNDWRIIATMNTIDKASLYEMSYAFMRRFAFCIW